jgi:hypothetical protein
VPEVRQARADQTSSVEVHPPPTYPRNPEEMSSPFAGSVTDRPCRRQRIPGVIGVRRTLRASAQPIIPAIRCVHAERHD